MNPYETGHGASNTGHHQQTLLPAKGTFHTGYNDSDLPINPEGQRAIHEELYGTSKPDRQTMTVGDGFVLRSNQPSSHFSSNLPNEPQGFPQNPTQGHDRNSDPHCQQDIVSQDAIVAPVSTCYKPYRRKQPSARPVAQNVTQHQQMGSSLSRPQDKAYSLKQQQSQPNPCRRRVEPENANIRLSGTLNGPFTTYAFDSGSSYDSIRSTDQRTRGNKRASDSGLDQGSPYRKHHSQYEAAQDLDRKNSEKKAKRYPGLEPLYRNEFKLSLLGITITTASVPRIRDFQVAYHAGPLGLQLRFCNRWSLIDSAPRPDDWSRFDRPSVGWEDLDSKGDSKTFVVCFSNLSQQQCQNYIETNDARARLYDSDNSKDWTCEVADWCTIKTYNRPAPIIGLRWQEQRDPKSIGELEIFPCFGILGQKDVGLHQLDCIRIADYAKTFLIFLIVRHGGICEAGQAERLCAEELDGQPPHEPVISSSQFGVPSPPRTPLPKSSVSAPTLDPGYAFPSPEQGETLQYTAQPTEEIYTDTGQNGPAIHIVPSDGFHARPQTIQSLGPEKHTFNLTVTQADGVLNAEVFPASLRSIPDPDSDERTTGTLRTYPHSSAAVSPLSGTPILHHLDGNRSAVSILDLPDPSRSKGEVTSSNSGSRKLELPYPDSGQPVTIRSQKYGEATVLPPWMESSRSLMEYDRTGKQSRVPLQQTTVLHPLRVRSDG
ncbi:hypothetical protein BJ508DRAFT_381233 [Ascobolus immersus RN42]|uniref:Uncharacterized protein n=1 Tax=Ascobolus immersus RN42 TaxID=1160509 RepID=A0A3N4HGB7_ASCIM|nr:hypothetical protein BJ508DRAFT_381233 [Ascobolus immersus RN42]